MRTQHPALSPRGNEPAAELLRLALAVATGAARRLAGASPHGCRGELYCELCGIRDDAPGMAWTLQVFAGLVSCRTTHEDDIDDLAGEAADLLAGLLARRPADDDAPQPHALPMPEPIYAE
jgi:hypothetical protein